MAAILKIYDGDRDTNLEICSFDEDQLLNIWIEGSDMDVSMGCSLDKQEVEEMIDYLQKQLKRME